MICEYCSKIFLDCPEDERTLRPPSEFAETERFECDLCTYFKACIRSTALDSASVLRFRFFHYHEIDIILPLWLGNPRLPILELQVQKKQGGALPQPTVFRAFTFEVLVSGDPLSDRFAGRPIAKDGASIASIDRLKEMLNRQDKDTATRTSPHLLPSRVIDVESDIGIVRLVSSDGVSGRWAALSHCWGQERSTYFNTTSINVKERMSGILLSEMPQTFQDAIVVTRHLGLRYLWIDSLCIVQGPGGDWVNEAAKMGEYYGNASICISADSANGDSDGFLKLRSSSSKGIETEFTTVEGKHEHDAADTIYGNELTEFEYRHESKFHHLLLRHVTWAGHSSSPDPVQDLPLHNRAWTLQERSLPELIFHFGLEQNYLSVTSADKIIYEDGREVYHSTSWRKMYSPDSALPFQNWYSMIEDYTTRNISFKADIFPAIGGLAQSVAKISGDAYRAGLWKSDLMHGLLWTAKDPRSPPRWAQAAPAGEKTDYCAPSWSWANVAGGGVRFWLNDLRNTVDIESMLLGYRPGDAISDEDAPLFNLISCGAPPLIPDFPEGQLVPYATLRIKAPVFPIKELISTQKESKNDQKDLKYDCILSISGRSYTIPNIKLDSALSFPSSPTNLHIICIARTTGGPDQQELSFGSVSLGPKDIFGLIIEEVHDQIFGSDPVFKRIGFFKERTARFEDEWKSFGLWDSVKYQGNGHTRQVVII